MSDATVARVVGWLAVVSAISIVACRSKPSLEGVAAKCASLTRAACMTSRMCTLLSARPKYASAHYVCRPARRPCETTVTQAELLAFREAHEECNTTPKCIVDVGNCYCHCRDFGRTEFRKDEIDTPECKCPCGGGPPPVCSTRVEVRAFEEELEREQKELDRRKARGG